jgi:predicted MFS family arabinose efflux permease
VEIANLSAPTHLKTTSQGMMNAMFGGVGSTAGSLLGGWIYGQFGPAMLFGVMAILNGAGMLVYFIDTLRQRKQYARNYGSVSNSITSFTDVY